MTWASIEHGAEFRIMKETLMRLCRLSAVLAVPGTERCSPVNFRTRADP
jgi:hypothetical protein